MTVATDPARTRAAASADAASPAAAPPSVRVERRVASLDGLRGVAVLLVLLFHFRLGPFSGGFVGVTVFFTLSGFLICSRTVGEVARRGGFSLWGFVERRVRRLAPASLLCLVGTCVGVLLVGTALQRRSLTLDVLAALANVANWRFLLHGTSYAELFSAPSPVEHYWSLAIEEQFYILFPLLVLLILRLPARRRGLAAGAVVLVASVASVYLGWHAPTFDRFYYGTDTRMIELLLGVGLALALRRWPLRTAGSAGFGRAVLRLAALAALVGIVVCGMVFRNGGSAYQYGGALLVAALTALLIAGLVEGGSAAARLLSWRPLVLVGVISYGVYLYHWPIYALSGHSWGPLHGTPLGLAQLAATLLLATASYLLLERPVMRRRLLSSVRALFRSWSVAVAAVATLAAALAGFAPAAAGAAGNPSGLDVPHPVVTPKGYHPVTSAGHRPLRVAVSGDSTGEVMANALSRYAFAHPDVLQVLDVTLPGCPITDVDRIRHYQGESGQDVSKCGLWGYAFTPRVQQFKPDVAVVFVSMMEQADQRKLGQPWENVLDPAWRDKQDHDMGALVDLLSSTGAPVLWADAPYGKFQKDLPWLSDSPERTDALNALFRRLASEHPQMRLLDYASRLNKPNHYVDTSIRPDGIHLTDAVADSFVSDWLLGQLKAAAPNVH